MMKLSVNASRKYDITVTSGFNEFHADVITKLRGKKVAIISDDTVNALYGDTVQKLFSDFETHILVIKSGEQSKNGENYLKLINSLASLSFQRNDAVVALGGGVVGDLAAFVASTYMRGITLVSVPTTLLSAVDSSVGGKTAIDLEYGKNLCGTFYQPHAVYINLDFLKSLPEKEVKNGYGEVIKYALLDPRVTKENLRGGIGEELIYNSLSVKRDIVEADEFEGNKRMLLNLGHTVGHAIEKLSGYSLSHGECVVKGLKAAVDVSEKLYGFGDKTYSDMLETVSLMGHDLNYIYGIKEIVGSVISDKKSAGDEVSFVTLKDVCNPEIRKIKINELYGLLKGQE